MSALAPFAPVTEYGTPDFSRITPEVFPPALAEARARHLAEIADIIGKREPATFTNTVEAWIRAGRDYQRVCGLFATLTTSCRNDAYNAIESDEAPVMSAHDDALFMNPELWTRIQAVYAQGRAGCPTDEAWRLVDLTYDAFRRHGAHLSETDRVALSALNQEEAGLTVLAQQRIQAAREAGVLCSADELAGMGPEELATMERVGDLYRLPLDNTTIQTSLATLNRDDVCDRIWAASCARGLGGEHDTRDIISKLDRVRAKRAALLGFDNHAHLVLDIQQTKTPERMAALLQSVAGPAQTKVREESQAMSLPEGARGLAVRARAERALREQVYALDEEAVKSYFQWERVLEDGLFRSATALYGLTFRRRDDIPVYHPDVTAYEVFDDQGKPMALFMVDPWMKPGKSGGAWMMDMVPQNTLFGDRPVVTNDLNLVKPAPGQPALMSIDEVQTAFHEFGHALHGLLSQVTYPTLGGLHVPTDFVELPSQIHEHWMLHADLLPHYARHVTTGEVLPDSLVQAIKAGTLFGQGYAMAELAAAAWLDLQWHSRSPHDEAIAPEAIVQFEAEALAQGGFDPLVAPPRYGTAYFNHIWGGGYSASYGAYIASGVLECDGFAWFQEHGGMTRENGRHFATTVLNPGHTRPVDELYRDFRGRDPELAPLLEDRGLMPSNPGRRPKLG